MAVVAAIVESCAITSLNVATAGFEYSYALHTIIQAASDLVRFRLADFDG